MLEAASPSHFQQGEGLCVLIWSRQSSRTTDPSKESLGMGNKISQ